MTVDLDRLRQWIGRTEEATDLVAPAPLAGLAATLDRDQPAPAPGDEVPPGGHWLYCLAKARQSELGPDGHPRRGGFLPPVPLPRRMWAGGRLEFLGPLRVGETVRRLSTIRDVALKQGRGGLFVLVQVRHEIAAADRPALVEEQDLVYREGDRAASSPPPSPPAAAVNARWRRLVEPDPVLLFRYSALTFNGHRIHYDRRYATADEGYPGLVVHGPLAATLLLDLCRRQRPEATIAGFDFRVTRPLFDGAPLTLVGAPAADGASAELWVLDGTGAPAVTATARFKG